MARIRRIEINNFRSIKSLTWQPVAGINCLIGPGDSGKSTIIDAIDFCLCARRTVQFNDADFYNLDVEAPISISLTLGELDDSLKSIDAYGFFLHGFDAATGEVQDEPEKDLEPVLTLNLTVGSDLEPTWSLVSTRAQAQNTVRNLAWGDRVRLSPNRIGVLSDFNLGWRRGSVLNRLTDEKADASAALAKAARDARGSFGDDAEKQLGEALRIVGETAEDLGIDVGGKVRALLDAHSVSFSGGTISLHDEDGVPLRNLGVGSTRLMIAGLQRKAAEKLSILLVDELEYGLEPHRIIRFLASLGAKEKAPPLQAFMTTHSPVALRELAGNQLFVLRNAGGAHVAQCVGTDDDVQGAIRLYPDAFLAASVIVCEGASEVGLLRGLDQSRTASGDVSIAACGVALVDGKGVDKLIPLAMSFHRLGYRVAVLRDDDKAPAAEAEKAFTKAGNALFKWRQGRALEDELFCSLSDTAIGKMLDYAVDLHGDSLIDDHIRTATKNSKDLEAVRLDLIIDGISEDTRVPIGKVARTKSGWFKTVSCMEELAREIVAPDLKQADADFRKIIEDVFAWASHD